MPAPKQTNLEAALMIFTAYLERKGLRKTPGTIRYSGRDL
jgi:Fur family ferric uptake transcriptional regulator